MIKAGVLGGDGYVAGELIRLLINHPDVDVEWIHSTEHAGERIDGVHRGIIGDTAMRFTDKYDITGIDVMFICTGTGGARAFLEKNDVSDDLKIIDLSGDYNNEEEGTHEFVYGLPELNRKRIVRGARRVATPGSVPMAVLPALLPLLKNLYLEGDIHVTLVSGSFEGKCPDLNFISENVSVDTPSCSTDVDEIKRIFAACHPGFVSDINILPIRGGFTRGILVAMYFECARPLEEIIRIYEEYYDDHNFTFILNDRQPELKDVVNTNKCVIHLAKDGDKLIVTSVIDNLLKGSAGTAVHNMNLLFGLSEKTGLNLKPAFF